MRRSKAANSENWGPTLRPGVHQAPQVNAIHVHFPDADCVDASGSRRARSGRLYGVALV